MSDPAAPPLYVALDTAGVEHAAEGPRQWVLPGAAGAAVTERREGLELRSAAALLDALDEVIWRAEAAAEGNLDDAGVLRTDSARLVARTAWDTERAASFAVRCASHVLGPRAEVALPDGTTLGALLEEAQGWLAQLTEEGARRLGYFGRLVALRKLHTAREELDEVSLGLLAEDDRRDLDALDDAAYTVVLPLLDAVLAAIEALRHHLLPAAEYEREEHREDKEEYETLDGRRRFSTSPSEWVTPIGNLAIGGRYLTRFEPAWAAARAAAEHARLAARDEGGADAEAAERAFQGDTLAAILADAG